MTPHQEGWKRLQNQDAIILVARILSRLTPVSTIASSLDAPADSESNSNRDVVSVDENLNMNRDKMSEKDRTSEAVGTTTAAALLRSQACNKVLSLLQQMMKINGTSELLRNMNRNVLKNSDGDWVPQQDSKTASAISDMAFLPPSTFHDEGAGNNLAVSNSPPKYNDRKDAAKSTISDEGKLIMRAVTRVLMAGPRTMLWFPALLKAAEVLQVLVLDASGAAEFLATMYSERVPLAHGTLESHILLDMLNSINSTLQPQRLRPVRSLEHHPVDL